MWKLKFSRAWGKVNLGSPTMSSPIKFELNTISSLTANVQKSEVSLQWRHNEHGYISNHQRLDCLLSPLFRHRTKKTSKLCVTGLCKGNLPVTSESPHKGQYCENVSIWWCHHGDRWIDEWTDRHTNEQGHSYVPFQLHCQGTITATSSRDQWIKTNKCITS